jgi:DUF1009 family protein
MAVEACKRRGQPFFVLGFRGETDPETVEGTPHAWVELGAIGHSIRLLRSHDVHTLVLAGRIARPKLTDLRPDFGTIRLIAKLAASSLTGDDAVFSIIVAHLESQGFRIVGVEQIVEDILTPEGLIGSIAPDATAGQDMRMGFAVAKTLGQYDIGQSVIVQRGLVLGVEAMEGTDALIQRCAGLRQPGGGGVLVKARKPQQESRVDLPTIGVRTVEKIAAAGLAGIAVETGATLMLYREAVAARADQLGVFVIGITYQEAAL